MDSAFFAGVIATVAIVVVAYKIWKNKQTRGNKKPK